jgi:hypothetical protein
VLPTDLRQKRHERRTRRRSGLNPLERLEERSLLSFTTLGFSTPDLVITGEAGPRAAWGGTLDVLAYLKNIGASTITEPTQQAPGSTSTADAGDSMVDVYISPHPNSMKGAVLLGQIEAPPVSQNTLEQLTASFTLPSRPSGFAGSGGKFYVRFLANASQEVLETHLGNNWSPAVPVSITTQALPELRAIALYVPSYMQPGDTIAPIIQVENLGTADTQSQEPVTVDLVASVTPTFTVGSSIVATYTVANIPAVSETPTKGHYKTFAQHSVSTPNNVVTIEGSAVTLPTSPATYYLGVVVDPNQTLKQLSLPSNVFELIHDVGPPLKTLPPAGVISAAGTEQFPTPPFSETIGVS